MSNDLIKQLEAIKAQQEREARIVRDAARANPKRAKADADADFIACLTRGGFSKRRYRV